MITALHRRSLPIALSVAMLVLAGAGCSKAAEKASERAVEEAVESQTGGQVDLDTDDGTVRVETEDGSYTTGLSEVPEEWPDDVPLPDPYTPGEGVITETPEGRSVGITGSTTMSPVELLDLLKAALVDWEISGDTSASVSDGTLAGAQWDNGDRRVSLAATDNGDGTATVVMSHTAPE